MSQGPPHLLPIALATAVPLHIMEIQARGGPSKEDYNRAQGIGQLLAEKGDILLFGSKKKGQAAGIFNQVAFGIAILAFCPGGVTLFGGHYEVKPPKGSEPPEEPLPLTGILAELFG